MKVYWASSRRSLAFARPRFCIRRFSKKDGVEWRDFSEGFFLPRTIERQKAKDSSFRVKSIRSTPSKEEWIKIVKKALQEIEKNRLEKVVLARRLEIECEACIDPLAIAFALSHPEHIVFLIQMAPHIAFLGATPETLFYRKNRVIHCDALAGTRPHHRQTELWMSEKDIREFQIVEKQIIQDLSPLCAHPPIASPATVRLASNVSHLFSNITGHLNENITDEQLIATLHPTPAVGGAPQKEAAMFIEEHEPFDRGLYASPIGWIDDHESEMAVAIRSSLMIGSKAYLYAGVGIVAGSDPEEEWIESEQKLSIWKRFFV
jgi:menaquinone-specific isochorismate synthase